MTAQGAAGPPEDGAPLRTAAEIKAVLAKDAVLASLFANSGRGGSPLLDAEDGPVGCCAAPSHEAGPLGSCSPRGGSRCGCRAKNMRAELLGIAAAIRQGVRELRTASQLEGTTKTVMGLALLSGSPLGKFAASCMEHELRLDVGTWRKKLGKSKPGATTLTTTADGRFLQKCATLPDLAALTVSTESGVDGRTHTM